MDPVAWRFRRDIILMMSNPESTASNPASEKSIRLIRPSVVVLCGPAACGKSTFAARHFRPTQIISSDHARSLVCDDEGDQRHSAEAFALVNFLIEQRLGINRLCVVDSTALTLEARKTLLDLARKHGVPCVVFLFDVPLETCIARDQARERSVGQAVIERQYRIFARERDNLEREGFDQVIKLLGDDLDKVRIDVLFRPIPRASEPKERVQPRGAPYQPGRHGEHNQRHSSHRDPVSPRRAPSHTSPVSQAPSSSASPQPAGENPSSRPASPAAGSGERF
jgi:protein phosphatase